MYRPEFYQYSSDEREFIKAPSTGSVRAIHLLVEYKKHSPTNSVETYVRWHRLYDMIVPEALRHGLMSLLSRSSSVSEASLAGEEKRMERPSVSEEEFQKYREHIKLIVDNPRAAREMFPDPDIRGKALPLMDALHTYATGKSDNIGKSDD